MSESRVQPFPARRTRWQGVLRPPSRHLLGALGLGLAAIGVAHRLAFLVTATGAVTLVLGIATLLAVLLTWGRQGSDFEGNLTFTGLFVLMVGLSAIRPYRSDYSVNLLLLAAAVAFVALEPPRTRGVRLWIVLAIILAAHVVLMLELPYPKQDVFRMLTNVVDALFHRLRDPYAVIVDPVSPDVRPTYLTYPPGAFLVVAPFRLLLGDVRWAFVAGEAVFVGAAAHLARRHGGLPTWRQALLLTPLVLPGTSQAYFDYGNHEWVLLAIAALALVLRGRSLLCGVLLGVGVVTKQDFIVFPVLFLLPWFSQRTLLWAAGAAAALSAPFFAWDLPGALRGVFVQWIPTDSDRLSIYGILRALHHDPGRVAAVALSAAGLVAAAACAWLSRQTPRDLGRALVACGVGMAIFSFMAKASAYNYFGYALTFVAWGLAVSGTGEGEETGNVAGVLGVAG